ncbi:MAG: DUF1905 domain-containing protein [Patescibacteria group bacterium]
MKKVYKFRSKVWLYPGMAGWHFAGVPKKESEEIKKGSKVKAGFGSIPVMVTIGKTKWKTSIFPDKRSGTYLLPLKALVRKKEEIFSEDTISFSLGLI